PIRFAVDPRSQTAQRPFDHRLIVRETTFGLERSGGEGGIQELYATLAADTPRHHPLLAHLVTPPPEGPSPLPLTERKDHLEFFAERLRSFARHVVVLRGGMTEKERREVMSLLASIGDGEERLLLATGRYIGEGFDDARLDTLFLALPVSWKGTLM